MNKLNVIQIYRHTDEIVQDLIVYDLDKVTLAQFVDEDHFVVIDIPRGKKGEDE